MKQLIVRPTIFVLLMLSIFINGCGKDSKTPEPVVPPVIPAGKTVTLDKTNATPGELVNITTSFTLTKDSYEIIVGGKKVILARLTDNTASFTMPVITQGATTIDFTALEVTAKSNYTIPAYTVITQPELVKQAFTDQLSLAIADVTDEADKKVLKVFEETIKQKYSLLNEEEKKELAYVLQKLNFEGPKTVASLTSNPFTLSALANSPALTMANGSLFPIVVPALITDDATYYNTLVQSIGLTALSWSLVNIGAAQVSSPTLITQLTGAATLSYATYVVIKNGQAIGKLYKYEPEAKIIAAPTNFLDGINGGNQFFKGEGPLKLSAVGTNGTVTFERDLEMSISLKASYNSLYQGTSNPVLKNFADKVVQFSSGYDRAIALINNVKSFFTSTPEMPVVSTALPATPRAATRNLQAEMITIQNVSDANITIVKTGTGNAIKLKAVSNIAGEKAFTFDVVYTNTWLGITIRKTIDAIYDGNAVPDLIEYNSGNNQNGQAFTALALPYKVKVMDKNKTPLANVTVNWAIKSGGGTIGAPTTTTDANGIASITITLGNAITQEVEASVKKKDGTLVSGAPVLFKSTIFAPKVYGTGNTPATTTNPQVFKSDKPETFVLKNQDGSALTINYNLVTIANTTNTKVTVSKTNTTSNFSLTLKTTETASQATSFDILYNAVKVQTMNATVSVDSTNYYNSVVPGDWTMVWTDPGVPKQSGQVDKFRFNADGTGIYYYIKTVSGEEKEIKPNEAVYQVRWSVVRESDGYYLSLIYPNRGWSSYVLLQTKPNLRVGKKITTGLYYIGTK